MQSSHEVPQLNGFLFTRFEHGFLFLILLHSNLAGGAAILLTQIGSIARHEFRQAQVCKQLA